MKLIQFSLAALFLIGFAITGKAQTTETESTAKVNENTKVEVYYFHLTRRCITCQSVESVSKKSIKKLYEEKVPFQALNIEEEKGKAIAGELGVTGQTLLIVSGETKINITNEAFMYARYHPNKLKTLLEEKIDPLL